tara:strand:- start:178 stop:990 length:813 start_codon:yes stop_codon:yes gene_type:complete
MTDRSEYQLPEEVVRKTLISKVGSWTNESNAVMWIMQTLLPKLHGAKQHFREEHLDFLNAAEENLAKATKHLKRLLSKGHVRPDTVVVLVPAYRSKNQTGLHGLRILYSKSHDGNFPPWSHEAYVDRRSPLENRYQWRRWITKKEHPDWRDRTGFERFCRPTQPQVLEVSALMDALNSMLVKVQTTKENQPLIFLHNRRERKTQQVTMKRKKWLQECELLESMLNPEYINELIASQQRRVEHHRKEYDVVRAEVNDLQDKIDDLEGGEEE